jgi:hypothetical protein
MVKSPIRGFVEVVATVINLTRTEPKTKLMAFLATNCGLLARNLARIAHSSPLVRCEFVKKLFIATSA